MQPAVSTSELPPVAGRETPSFRFQQHTTSPCNIQTTQQTHPPQPVHFPESKITTSSSATTPSPIEKSGRKLGSHVRQPERALRPLCCAWWRGRWRGHGGAESDEAASGGECSDCLEGAQVERAVGGGRRMDGLGGGSSMLYAVKEVDARWMDRWAGAAVPCLRPLGTLNVFAQDMTC